MFHKCLRAGLCRKDFSWNFFMIGVFGLQVFVDCIFICCSWANAWTENSHSPSFNYKVCTSSFLKLQHLSWTEISFLLLTPCTRPFQFSHWAQCCTHCLPVKLHTHIQIKPTASWNVYQGSLLIFLFVCLFTPVLTPDRIWLLLLLLMKSTVRFQFQAVSKDR